jgi:prepilin peptidase CpaA
MPLPVSVFQEMAVALAIVAAAWDLRTRRIPNVLTFGAALVAVLLHGYFEGLNGLGLSLAGWAVGLALFLPFFALGGLGAGDVKLLAAVGACLGPLAAVWVALYTSIAGGAMALAVASYSGYLRQAFVNLWCVVMYWRLEGPRPVPEMTLATHKGPRLAYAIPLLAGVMLTLWLR